jgi:hypothetical protein
VSAWRYCKLVNEDYFIQGRYFKRRFKPFSRGAKPNLFGRLRFLCLTETTFLDICKQRVHKSIKCLHILVVHDHRSEVDEVIVDSQVVLDSFIDVHLSASYMRDHLKLCMDSILAGHVKVVGSFIVQDSYKLLVFDHGYLFAEHLRY